MIIKDQINIIENYTTYKNLYNFLIDKGELIYKCDLCKCNFKNIKKKNKIIYSMKGYNNNILSSITNPLINKFDNLNLEELFVINNINYYNIKYEKCNFIFCNLCLYNVNNRTFKLQSDNLLFDYISYDFLNYINVNNMYFIKDKIINNKNISIKRIIFHKKNDLIMKYIIINNLSELKLSLLKKNNYETLNDIIKYDFNFDIEYLKEYLKIKYD